MTKHILQQERASLKEALNFLQPTARVILEKRPMKFVDETYDGFQALLDDPMRQVLANYTGSNTFLMKLRQVTPWSARQSRAIANILRASLRDGKTDSPTPPTLTTAGTTSQPAFGPPSGQPSTGPHKMAAPAAPVNTYDCFKCGAPFPTMQAVIAHRQVCTHKSWGRTQAPAQPPKAVPVLPDFKPVHNLDLRSLPVGNYAIEDRAANKWRFFKVVSLKRPTTLKGKYAWTKFRYAYERLEAGTITVREQVGDTKRFCGKQKPGQGEVFIGEPEVEEFLKVMLENPAYHLQEYGRRMNKCGYCGRSLTDEDSRLRGIGPDCWEQKHIPFTQRRYSNGSVTR